MIGNHGEFRPDMSPDDGTGGNSDDLEDDSLENVREELDDNDDVLHGQYEELADARMIAGEDEIDLLEHPDLEIEEEDIPRFVESISLALQNVGVYRSSEITEQWLEQKLAEVDPEVLKNLNPYTAESLFFHTYKKVRIWLGNEFIHPSRLIDQAVHIHNNGDNLETQQLLQRLRDLEYLTALGIDPDQLMDLLGGSEGEKQNINRLGFLLAYSSRKPAFIAEPRLKDYILRMHNEARTGLTEFLSVEAVVIEAQEILKKELADIEEKSKPEERRKWDSIANDKYRRTVHRIRSSINIGDTILNDMRHQNSLPAE